MPRQTKLQTIDLKGVSGSNVEVDGKIHQRFDALDGLRAVALISVMIHHYAPALFSGGTFVRDLILKLLDLGGLGVDLFFSLSGFLITGILYDSVGSKAFFGRFYWRRSLRIFPAYFAYLVPFLFLSPLFANLSRWWFILYLRNWMGPDPSSDYLLGHLWSLAVEEQFYIFWAMAIYLCPRKYVPQLIFSLCFFTVCFRAEMIILNYSRYDQLRFTLARTDALLSGGLIAVLWRTYRWSVVRRIAKWCGILSLVAFTGILIWKGSLENRLAELLLPSLSAAFFASVVALTLTLKRSLLIHPWLAHIAKYSYAMYLWHLAPNAINGTFLRMAEQRPHLLVLVKVISIPAMFLVTYLIARLSWAAIEQPLLSLKDRLYTLPITSAGQS